MTFAFPFLLFPKALSSYGKNVLKYFLSHCTFICKSSKSVSQIFKILFQTGDIEILSFAVSFLVDMFNLLVASLLTKKISAVKSEAHFSREAIGN